MFHNIEFFIKILILLATITNARAVEEEKKFIIAIDEENPLDLKAEPKFRCYGTVISQHHVVTTADCVSLDNQNRLVLGVQSVIDDGTGFLRFGSTKGECAVDDS